MPQPYRPKGSKQREKEAAFVPPPRPEETALASPQPKFGQALGSNDKEVREKAVKALQGYLQRAADIEELELRKIWKALFYCFWHSDKRKVQEDLADRLGAFVHSMASPDKAWLFVKVFWGTMSREWTGIDRLRLDKFYTLLRRSVSHTLKMVAQVGWDHEAVASLAETLGGEGGPLHPKAPVGLRYFMCDYFMPSLQETLAKAGGLSGPAMLAVLEPFLVLCGQAEDDVTLRKLVEGVVQPVLLGGKQGAGAGAGDDDDDDDDEEDDDDEKKEEVTTSLPQPLDSLAERLFDLASDKGTKERNRRLLYALQQRVEKLASTEEGKAASALASSSNGAGSKAGKAVGKGAKAAAKAASKGGKAAAKAAKGDGSSVAAAAAAAAAEQKQQQPDAAQLEGLRSLLSKKGGLKKKRTIDVVEIGKPSSGGRGAEEDGGARGEEGKRPKKASRGDKEGGASPSAAAADAAAAAQSAADKRAAKVADVEKADKIARDAAALAKGKALAAQKATGQAGGSDGAEGGGADFQPAKKFGGAKKGFVFKKGAKGIGYYHDVPPVAVVKAGKGGPAGGGGKRRR